MRADWGGTWRCLPQSESLNASVAHILGVGMGTLLTGLVTFHFGEEIDIPLGVHHLPTSVLNNLHLEVVRPSRRGVSRCKRICGNTHDRRLGRKADRYCE